MNLLIITIPLVSSLSLLFLSRFIGFKGSKIISVGSLLINIGLSFNILYYSLKNHLISKIDISSWINIGIFNTKIELIFDKENIIMINLISIITMIVIYYSYWYLEGDAHITRFISYLLIFAVTMYLLVLSNNFILMFGGWETVGIMSYLLINYWSTSLNSNKSSFKAILFNKVGDIAFLFALILLFFSFNNFNISYSPEFNLFQTPSIIINNYCGDSWISLIFFAFLISAIAKSAQFFLHCWLGDAMAGPTPVSALLHAATMVTAGIFLLFRLNNYLFNIENTMIVNTVILIIGAITILFAGLSSIYQYDIKKIIAFSTCSQIGYMFINNGLIPYSSSSSLFHLFTHGFFKALLFLCAGILIHNLYNEQDIRKYGGLLIKFPLSYSFLLIGTLSIISFPFLSGFYSKETILFNSFLTTTSENTHSFFLFVLLLGAFFTSLYSFKLFFNTFFSYPNYPNSNILNKIREIPITLFIFLIPLLCGSIFIGFLFNDYLIGPGVNNITLLHSFLPPFLHFLPLFSLFLGFLFSFFELPFYYFYLIANLFNRRLFLDPLFNYLLAYPVLSIGYHFSFKLIDRGFLEYFGPLGLFRTFYYFPNNYSLASQSLLNFSYLFFYLFLSFFFFFSFFLF